MFLSEYGDDDKAARTRDLMPMKTGESTGRLEDGQMATAALTEGDGACSLHSLWGSVISSPLGNKYFCEDARRKLCVQMPTDVNDILNSRCGAAVRDLIDDTWTDLKAYVKRRIQKEDPRDGDEKGVAVMWRHLPSSQKRMIEELVEKRPQ